MGKYQGICFVVTFSVLEAVFFATFIAQLRTANYYLNSSGSETTVWVCYLLLSIRQGHHSSAPSGGKISTREERMGFSCGQ